ncbi:hypothetical protein C8A03DRAFT_18123 [Achaetomium macrosporum]|uniref:Uncharacterized protein n=1 Tax=Achaetomium macrosporum TaxID=79813 RepID=A0AAN7H8F6_9PEZI|nr:hypothetical protein C8A03DRAFT_18123 [Achaetomium macrosporum]
MHRPWILNQLLSFVLLALVCPFPAQGTKTRKDLCGVSMHARDFPDRGSFSAVEATFTVPQVAYDPIYDPAVTGKHHQNASYFPYVNNCVALCCGDDCSTRLSAGVQAFSLAGVDSFTASIVFQIGPVFAPETIRDERFQFNSSDTVWVRLEILQPQLARITFTKFQQSDSTNHTIRVEIGIAQSPEGDPIASISTSGLGQQDKPWLSRGEQGVPTPSLCGDSAWWYVSDMFDAGESAERPERLPRFSPVLIANHGLEASNGQGTISWPSNLVWSGEARFWNMVRDEGGKTEELCRIRGFVDSGMTLVQSSNPWMV